MQTHTRARACADADVRRCTRARVGGRRCRHRRETRARAQRTRARTRGRKPRCMRATQMQTHPRARADADADALTRRCRRRFGRTCIDRDGVRFPLNAVNRAANNAIGEKTSSSNGSGVQLGGRHGIGIIFNGGLAVSSALDVLRLDVCAARVFWLRSASLRHATGNIALRTLSKKHFHRQNY